MAATFDRYANAPSRFAPATSRKRKRLTRQRSAGVGLSERPRQQGPRAEMLIEGDAHTLLDGLVTGLSVEPEVSAVSWQAEDTDTGSDDDNDDRPDRPGARRRTWWRPTAPTE